jgi:integrase
MARKPKLGEHMRLTPSGSIALQFTVDGERRSGRKILPDLPASYPHTAAGIAAAKADIRLVEDHIAQAIDRKATVRGFWERWTDVDDKQWGHFGSECPKRSEHAIYTMASATRPFVEMYAERHLSTLNDTDIRAYVESKHYAPSQMERIATFLTDAETAGLRRGVNPAVGAGRKAGAYLRNQRERSKTSPPTASEVYAMLVHLYNRAYPRSLYGWFLTGTRTGMRGGEIDGMRFEHVDFDACTYEIKSQFHPRTYKLDVPKHNSVRKVFLDDDVMREIELARAGGAMSDYIWTNSKFDPWRHTSRNKWWAKEIDGVSLKSIVGGATMYNATRHHWASWAVNELGMSPYQASILYGHSDGGKLISKTYATPDNDAAIEALKRANANRPISLDDERRKRR